MSIRYRYANGSPKRDHFEGLHGFAKGQERKAISIRNRREKPIRIESSGPITTCAKWKHAGTELKANGHSFTGEGCTSTEHRWWKQSLLAMKAEDMPLRDMEAEKLARRHKRTKRII